MALEVVVGNDNGPPVICGSREHCQPRPCLTKARKQEALVKLRIVCGHRPIELIRGLHWLAGKLRACVL
jgi:hypothetical protein